MSELTEFCKAAKKHIVSAIAGVESAALSGYSAGERASWPTQLAEAAAFRGVAVSDLLDGKTGAAGDDLAAAPFLTGACAAERGPANDAARRSQVNALALSVAANAVALAQLSQALIGIRRRAFSAIDVGRSVEVQQALDAAIGEISALGER